MKFMFFYSIWNLFLWSDTRLPSQVLPVDSSSQLDWHSGRIGGPDVSVSAVRAGREASKFAHCSMYVAPIFNGTENPDEKTWQDPAGSVTVAQSHFMHTQGTSSLGGFLLVPDASVKDASAPPVPDLSALPADSYRSYGWRKMSALRGSASEDTVEAIDSILDSNPPIDGVYSFDDLPDDTWIYLVRVSNVNDRIAVLEDMSVILRGLPARVSLVKKYRQSVSGGEFRYLDPVTGTVHGVRLPGSVSDVNTVSEVDDWASYVYSVPQSPVGSSSIPVWYGCLKPDALGDCVLPASPVVVNSTLVSDLHIPVPVLSSTDVPWSR